MPTNATAPDPTAAPAAVPSILLFGHPGSGKSSLLGALLQASDTQPDRLEAEVADPGRRLELLRDAVYGGAGFEIPNTPLVTHRIVVRPLATEGEPVPEPFPLLILDCDGGAAASLLSKPDPLTEKKVRGPVVQAVVETDVLVLAVNAGASEDELHRTFEDFLIFLERVQGRKTFAREVGGFPIFLVLTQCDRLARKGDTAVTWERRVAERLDLFLARLTEYLGDYHPDPGIQSPYLPFGSVELKGYAVAVRRPELADDPNPPDEPFGAADLFRDCFAAARTHRQRVAASDLRLWWTVRSVLFAVGLMLAGVLTVLAFQPSPRDALADRVEEYMRRGERPVEQRLAQKNIAQTERTLKGFREDPRFEHLPHDLRKFVVGRLEEVEGYKTYRRALEDPAHTSPAEARTHVQLDAIQARLAALPLPPEWAKTEAGELRQKWLDDIRLIEQTVKRWNDWYWLQAGITDAQARADAFDASWLAAVEKLLAEAEHPAVKELVPGSTDIAPVRLDQPIPGSRDLPMPKGSALTFGTTYWFEQASMARDQWAASRGRLIDLRELADALALTPPPPAPDPNRPLYGVLFVPPPEAGPVLPPAARVDALEKRLGATSNPAERWRLDRFDEPARSRLAGRVEESRRNAERATIKELTAKREEVAKAGGGKKPDAETWRDLGAVVEADARFRNWGRLMHVLARLRDPVAPDPVVELVGFLKRDRFEINLNGFELRVPTSYQPKGKPVVPTGPISVTVGTSPVRFKAAGHDDLGVWTVYRFVPEAGGRVVYQPGQELRVAVPVNVGDGAAAELVWAEGGPPAFQFERLNTPAEPKLVQGGDVRPAPGVRLIPQPVGPLPTLPALLPR